MNTNNVNEKCPRLVNIADIRETIVGQIFLHFNAAQWKYASSGLRQIEKLPPGPAALEASFLPGPSGGMLATPSCPPGCTSRYVYSESSGPVTDPQSNYFQVLIACDCSGDIYPDPRNHRCHLAFRITPSPASQLLGGAPVMICVDNSVKICPETAPAWFRTSNNSFICLCAPIVR
jgi:hypothetical protein